MKRNGELSLMEKVNEQRKSDPKFDRAHRMVQLFMAAWAAIVILDRMIGVATQAYADGQMTSALIGGALLVFVAFLGTRGHIQGAMMLMQINLAVILIQFVATCFLYTESTQLWSVLFYGASTGVLIACSLMLFLNRNLESYRACVRQMKGKGERKPLFYRTNNRLIRNKKR